MEIDNKKMTKQNKENSLVERIEVYYLGITNYNPNYTAWNGWGADNRHTFFVPSENYAILSRWGISFKDLKEFCYISGMSKLGKEIKKDFNERLLERRTIKEISEEEKERVFGSIDEEIEKQKKFLDMRGINKYCIEEEIKNLEELKRNPKIALVYTDAKGNEQGLLYIRPCEKVEVDKDLLNRYVSDYKEWFKYQRNLKKLDKDLCKGLSKVVER